MSETMTCPKCNGTGGDIHPDPETGEPGHCVECEGTGKELCPGDCGSHAKRHLDAWWDCGTYREIDGRVVRSAGCKLIASLRTQLSAAQQAREAAERERDEAKAQLSHERNVNTIRWCEMRDENRDLTARLALAEAESKANAKRADELEEGVRKTRNDVASLYNACLELQRLLRAS